MYFHPKILQNAKTRWINVEHYQEHYGKIEKSTCENGLR
jgi:hypothetical protein